MTDSEFLFGEDRRQCDERRIETYHGRSYASSDSRESPLRMLARPIAGSLSIVVAVFAGMAHSNSTMVQSIETAQGEAILMNPPDEAFKAAVALLFVAGLLVVYAVGGRR